MNLKGSEDFMAGRQCSQTAWRTGGRSLFIAHGIERIARTARPVGLEDGADELHRHANCLQVASERTALLNRGEQITVGGKMVVDGAPGLRFPLTRPSWAWTSEALVSDRPPSSDFDADHNRGSSPRAHPGREPVDLWCEPVVPAVGP